MAFIACFNQACANCWWHGGVVPFVSFYACMLSHIVEAKLVVGKIWEGFDPSQCDHNVINMRFQNLCSRCPTPIFQSVKMPALPRLSSLRSSPIISKLLALSQHNAKGFIGLSPMTVRSVCDVVICNYCLKLIAAT